MTSIQSKTKDSFLANLASWKEAKQPCVVRALRKTKNPLPPQAINLASDVRSLCENKNSWNLVWLQRKSPAPQKDSSRLMAPLWLPWAECCWEGSPRILFGHICFHSPLTLQPHLPSNFSFHPSFLVSQICSCFGSVSTATACRPQEPPGPL